MNLYFAPLEGITTYTFRNTHYEMFGGCDEYFAPFITPTENEKLSIKNMRDILPENNAKAPVVQALASSSAALVDFTERIKQMGYDEVNINFGCPSGTVVKKGRGAGALSGLRFNGSYRKRKQRPLGDTGPFLSQKTEISPSDSVQTLFSQ